MYQFVLSNLSTDNMLLAMFWTHDSRPALVSVLSCTAGWKIVESERARPKKGKSDCVNVTYVVDCVKVTYVVDCVKVTLFTYVVDCVK